MNELNERIAAWAGLECRCQFPAHGRLCWDKQHSDPDLQRYWGNCPRHENGGNPPDYSRDDVAVGLLKILVDKGYTWRLQDIPHREEYGFQLALVGEFHLPLALHSESTISAAICAALEKLMDKESK